MKPPMQGCEMRMLDLFSGLGGFTLAAREVWDVETVSFVEIDKRCREFLARAWPGIPIHDDIKTLDASKWRGTIDLMVGGPPCQPASRAGKQKGSEDDRWLWDETLRVCEECLPTWCLFENPPGIGDVGLDGILTHLEGIGYEVQTVDIPACAVNSPNRRHRYWIIGYLENPSESRARSQGGEVGGQGRKPVDSWPESLRCGELETCSDGLDTAGAEHCHLANLRGAGCEGSITESREDGLHSKHYQSHMAHTKKGRKRSREPRINQRSRKFMVGSESGCDLSHNAQGDLADSKATPRLCVSNRKEYESPPPYGRCCTKQWGSHIWLPCADGKVRRAPDDSQRMAHGLPVELLEALGEEGREGWTPEDCEPHRSLLGALGNSIVPQVAVEIFKAMKGAGLRRNE